MTSDAMRFAWRATLCCHHAHGDTPVLHPTGGDGHTLAVTTEARDAVFASTSLHPHETKHAWRPTRRALRGRDVRHHAHEDTPVLRRQGGDVMH